MNFDMTLIERDGYTILELLADVGGFQGFLTSAISLFMGILNYS